MTRVSISRSVRLIALLAVATAVAMAATSGSLTITTTSLPMGIQGESYNQTLMSSGGTGAVTWSIGSSFVLPTGLALNAATGAITGTPTTRGGFSFPVMAQDSANHTATQQLQINVVRSGQISYVAVDATANSLVLVAGDGSSVTTIASHIAPTQSGYDVAQDAGGNFIVAAVNSLVRVTPAGTISTIATAPSGSQWLAVAVDGVGNFIVGDNQQHEIWRVSPDGSVVAPVAMYPVAQLSRFEGVRVLVDAHGNYVVAEDNGSNGLQANLFYITPAGRVTGIPLTGGTVVGLGGITFDANGNYIWIDYSQRSLFQIAPAGSSNAGAATALVTNISSTQLQGLAKNPQSSEYVTGGQNGMLIIDAASGAINSLVTSPSALPNPAGVVAVAGDFISTVDATYPLGYFRLENASGVSEVNGYTYNLSSGATIATPGANIGDATNYASLNGTTGNVTTSLSGTISTAASIMAWVKLSVLPSNVSNAFEYIAGESANGNDFDLQFDNSNVLRFYTTNNGQNLSYTPNLNTLAGQWHMVVATFDAAASQRAIYWDGALVASDTVTSSTNKTGAFEIGASSVFASRFFYGGIDEVGLWNYALTQEQVYRIFASTAGNFASPYSSVITSLSPAHTPIQSAASPVTLTISGQNLYSPTTVWFTSPSGPTTIVPVAQGTQMGNSSVQVNIPSSVLATQGTYEVAVGNYLGVPANQLPLTVGPSALTISTTSLPVGVSGQPYSATVSATGGSGSYLWSITSQSAPLNLTINASTGALSGTPTGSNTDNGYSLTVKVIDTVTQATQSQTFTIPVYPPLIITTTSPPNGTVGQFYSYAFMATGGSGSGNYSWSLNSDSKDGLSISNNGVLSGTPTSPQSELALTVMVTDQGTGAQNSLSFDISIANASIAPMGPQPTGTTAYVLNEDGVLDAVAGGSFRAIADELNCTTCLDMAQDAAGDFVIAAGNGIIVLSSTGSHLAYIPKANANSVYFSVAVDPAGNYIVADPGLNQLLKFTPQSPGQLPGGTPTVIGSWNVSPPYSSSDAYVRIDNSSSHNYILAADAFTDDGATMFQIFKINPSAPSSPFTPLSLSGSTLPTAAGGLTFDTNGNYVEVDWNRDIIFTINASTLAVTELFNDPNGYLAHPKGIVLDARSGNFFLADDDDNNDALYTLNPTPGASHPLTQIAGFLDAPSAVIVADTIPLNVNDYVIENDEGSDIRPVGSSTRLSCGPCSSEITDFATDAQGNFIAAAGSTLVKIPPTGGGGSAIATAPQGSYFFSVAVDSAGNYIVADNQQHQILRIPSTGGAAPYPAIGYKISTQGQSGEQVFVRIDSTGNYVVAQDNGAQSPISLYRISPSALTTSTSTPVTPLNLQPMSPLTIPVTNIGGLTIDAGGNYVITDEDLGVIYTVNPANNNFSTLFGNPNDVLTTPTGIYLDPVSGNFLVVDFEYGALYSLNPTATQLTLISLGLSAPTSVLNYPTVLTITTPSLLTGTQGQPYTAILTAAGGSGSYTWSATGLPANLTISSAGVISGTPAAATTNPASVMIMAMDNTGSMTVQKTYLLTIAPGASPLSITTTSLAGGTTGQAYTTSTLTATGGSGSYAFSAANLPPGLSVSAAGIVSGTPTFSGTYSNVVVTVTDRGTNATAMKTFSIAIGPGPLSILTSMLPNGLAKTNYGPFQLAASGGSGHFSWLMTGAPAGLSLSSAGSLSGTPSVPAGNYPGITVTLTDTAMTSSSTVANFSITISPVTVSYPNFTSNMSGTIPGLTLNGIAAPATSTLDGPVLRLTAALSGQNGSAFTTSSVLFQNNNADTFSTFFQFRVTNPTSPPADGFVFVLQPVSANQPTGSLEGGGAKDYMGITSSVGVVFSIYPNPAPSNAVAVVENGNLSFLASAVLPTTGNNDCSSPVGVTGCLANGDLWSAWIDYDGTNLHIAVADNSTARPSSDLITFPLSLPTVLGTNTAFAGFTAATGLFYENHDITSWEYNNTYSPFTQTITTTSLPSGTVGAAYGPVTVMASGGTAPYTWTAVGLPSSLTISSGGIISGTPTAAGTFSGVKITATDATGVSVSQTYSVTISSGTTNPPPPPPSSLVITTSALPNGTPGQPYGPVQLTASGGTLPYTWSISNQSPGLSLQLSPAGVLTGVLPSAAALYTINVSVQDSLGSMASQFLLFSISASAPALSTGAPPSGMVNQPYGFTFGASGGSGSYGWAASGVPGLQVNSLTGTLSGTPTTAGTFTLSVTVTDTSTTQSTTATYSVTIAPLGLSITTTSLPNGAVGAPYPSITLTAAGGFGKYSFSASGAPPGITVSSTGVVSGTPTAGGTFSAFTVTVTDTTSKQTATQTYSVSITSAPLTITSSGALGGFVPGASVSASFSANGGNSPYTWTASGLPSGLTLTSSSGALAGTAPQAPGNYSFGITVMDSQSPASSASLTVNFSVFGFTTTSPLPSGTTTTPYSANILAAGGTPPYTFSATGVPAGLTLASSGFLSGTPAAPGSSSLAVTVTDSKGLSVSGSFALTIGSTVQPVQVSGASLPDGTVTTSYSQALEADGGKPPYNWSIIGGSLPAGLTLSAAGTISGTPAATGLATFTARATDTAGGFASAAFTIMVDPNSIHLTNIVLPNGIAGSTYPPQTIAANGGMPPYTSFLITSGSLPPGISFSNDLTAGQISGMPTSAGSYGFTVTTTDQGGNTASGSFSLTVEPPHADLILAQGSVSFALAAGATGLPAGSSASVPVLSSATLFQSLNYAVTPSAVAWLDVSGGPTTPAAVVISLDPSAVNLVPGNYQASVAVTCQAPSPCSGSMRSIAVNLVVTSPAPQLSLSSGLLSFSATGLTAQTLTQPVSLQNTGGGAITGISASAADPWVTLSGVPSTLTAGQSVPVTVTVNTASLAAGYYQSTITVTSSAGSANVPVTLLLSSSPTITLNPSGSQFLEVVGSTPGNTHGSFLVSVSGSSTVNWNASVPPVANAPVQPSAWLTLNTPSGSSTSASPGAINFSVNPSALGAGTYYATIRVTEASSDTNPAIDTPQDYLVVLNISPGSISTINPSPGGLIFIAAPGAAPPPQTVQVFASTANAAPISYLATPSTVSGGSWLSVSSTTGMTNAITAGVSTISVTPGTLAPGVYRGTVAYQLQSGGAAPAVNVTLIIQNATGKAAPSDRISTSAASASCTPSQIIPTQTGLTGNFAQPTSWPTPLTIRLLDDCAHAIANGQVVATFTNGDPPVILQAVDTVSGTYSGTWTPHSTAPQVTIAARATAPSLAPATLMISGQVTPVIAPVLSPNGTVNIFVPVAGSPLAPGLIVQIYGLNLAAQSMPSNTVPLTTAIGNTSVLIGGVQAPLYYVSPTQINAQVPFELTVGKPYQVLIDANGALSTPSGIQVGPDDPGIASFASGQIIAQHGATGALVTDANPAAPGEYVVFYVAGMGLTTQTIGSGQPSPSNPAAMTLDQPMLTLNGQNAPIAFAGLTPTYVGLYQVNFQVPANAPNGDLQLVLTQSGGQSNQTVLAVHN